LSQKYYRCIKIIFPMKKHKLSTGKTQGYPFAMGKLGDIMIL
jgi:hypothetical protein